MSSAPERGAVRCYTWAVPTSHPRHSVTETPALAAVLEPLRRRLGDETPSFGELVKRGAEATLAEVEARDRASSRALETFVARMEQAPAPDLEEVARIRHSTRRP